MNFNDIKYIVIDVDGTMTDGGIYYDNNGNEFKKFNVRDAAGFFAFRAAEIKIIVLTGRMSCMVEKRMNELSVDYLFQDVKDKKVFLQNFLSDNNIQKNELAYIGDDLNDYAAMSLAGFVACPFDACKEIADIANFRTVAYGGNGVVREVAEYILTKIGIWHSIIEKVYNISGC